MVFQLRSMLSRTMTLGSCLLEIPPSADSLNLSLCKGFSLSTTTIASFWGWLGFVTRNSRHGGKVSFCFFHRTSLFSFSSSTAKAMMDELITKIIDDQFVHHGHPSLYTIVLKRTAPLSQYHYISSINPVK